MLIPGTTSYRDIEHEDDVTTSCAQGMTSNCNDDVKYEDVCRDAGVRVKMGTKSNVALK